MRANRVNAGSHTLNQMKKKKNQVTTNLARSKIINGHWATLAFAASAYTMHGPTKRKTSSPCG